MDKKNKINNMFNPLIASENIKNTFKNYISTSFNIADPSYRLSFDSALDQPGVISRGPYVDIGSSYETGKTLREMMADGIISPLFEVLEEKIENKKELPLDRPLYTHQAEALFKSTQKRNLVITTGTGSGKTESFMMPIINSLLREEENGELGHGVRAILIYPMNALANDQLKRLRRLLEDSNITFGSYTGNTLHTEDAALSDFKENNKDADGNSLSPLKNEMISRERMQRTPPNILITNYSMLEYMMLRPNDDQIFSGANLKYIVLDEAHIYKGATGMETSLLLRRLKARISERSAVQYILTSATLGGEDANDEIISFASRLCGEKFEAYDIIRSKEKNIPMIEYNTYPMEMFTRIARETERVEKILKEYNCDFAPNGDDYEKIFELLIRSKLFASLKRVAVGPVTIRELLNKLKSEYPDITEENLISFISVCNKAEKNRVSLIKARYHFFLRALEGAYITLGEGKQLFLKQAKTVNSQYGLKTVFECAVCVDCGRLAICGIESNGKLLPGRNYDGEDDNKMEYFIIKDQNTDVYEADDEDVLIEEDTELNYIICPVCGRLMLEETANIVGLCEHDRRGYIKLRKAQKRKSSHKSICPICEHGTFRSFYIGGDAATAVIATALYEEMPQKIITVTNDNNEKKVVFGKVVKKSTEKVQKKHRQFLTFTDNRNQAAFFASYMEKSYHEFLRRRGIWQLCEQLTRNGTKKIRVRDFVDRLSTLYMENKTFSGFEDSGRSPQEIAREHAWIAILVELFDSRRSSSLSSLGKLGFRYYIDPEIVDGAKEYYSEEYGISPDFVEPLLQLMFMDVVFSGAIRASDKYTLDETQMEYIFHGAKRPKKIVYNKVTHFDQSINVISWLPRIRTGNKKTYIKNNRFSRLLKILEDSNYPEAKREKRAIDLLEKTWEAIFEDTTDGIEHTLSAQQFDIILSPEMYRCQKCGRLTSINCNNHCISTKCDGQLERIDIGEYIKDNHYANLYAKDDMVPLYIKEHTAQLSKENRAKYQNLFKDKKINALSCSTTFEMGVDIGSLETVYLRNVPPSPANYVQRAGRAGRALKSAAYSLTYAKLSSHDLTFFDHPKDMISGKIRAPQFQIKNEKIIKRHIFAVALSSFFKKWPEEYDRDNQETFLEKGGYERFVKYINSKPEDLKLLLKKSIPEDMHKDMMIESFGWRKYLFDETEGVLSIAYQDYHNNVQILKTEREKYRNAGKYKEASSIDSKLRALQGTKLHRKSLIDFLVRNNVLPKYGFPVDTVQLNLNINDNNVKDLDISRDLQMAISEYAPGAQVVADGRLYTSRYIKTYPSFDSESWETGWYVHKCPECNNTNFTKQEIPAEGKECISCGAIIEKSRWKQTIEPRMGFITDKNSQEVPMKKPEKEYKINDCYVGDQQAYVINSRVFNSNGNMVKLESTKNDTLVVVTKNDFYVCPICGHAQDSNEYDKKIVHVDSNGRKCNGTHKPYYLSHSFKTDVVRLTFYTPLSVEYNYIVSAMYAILEAMSKELDIERTDIKGCLYYNVASGIPMYSMILYDAVPGGAGHVRRLDTPDGNILNKVIIRAINAMDNCNCEPSCYSCLRNYYNQTIHEELDRRLASEFLKYYSAPYSVETYEVSDEYN